MTEPQRLSKRVTELFQCSRREAELLIEGGWVLVDGVVQEAPQFKVLGQAVTLHPDAVAEPVPPATLLLHKPAGVALDSEALLRLVQPDSRWAGDDSRMRMLKKHFSRLKPLLTLEPDACGLQVLTQDFRVERKLVDDGARLEQEWIVEVSGTLVDNGLQQLNQAGVKVSWQSESRLRFAVKNPAPGQIRDQCAGVGLQVVSMKRIRLGRIAMAALPEGQWCYLPSYKRF